MEWGLKTGRLLQLLALLRRLDRSSDRRRRSIEPVDEETVAARRCLAHRANRAGEVSLLLDAQLLESEGRTQPVGEIRRWKEETEKSGRGTFRAIQQPNPAGQPSPTDVSERVALDHLLPR